MSRLITNRTAPVAALAAALIAVACGPSNRLADYDLYDRTVVIHTTMDARPAIRTGDVLHVDTERPVRTALRLSTGVVKEVEAHRARSRLDSATFLVDVAGLISDAMAEKAAVQLGMRPVREDRRADYLLDVRILESGIDAHSWEADAYFYLEAEVALVHRPSNRLIWDTRVVGTDAISPAIFGPHPTIRNVVTAAALSRLSVDDMALALENLALFSSDEIGRKLQHDLYRARR